MSKSVQKKVILCYGKHPKKIKLWAFSLQDLANLLGKSVAAVRKDIERQKFDPQSLESIFNFVFESRKDLSI